MARIRTVKPDLWTDEKLTECSVSARLLFIGLLNFADDYGNQRRSAKKIKMQIFPADNIDVEPLLAELETNDLVIPYTVDGEIFIHIKGFLKHQKINRPSPPQYPLHDDSVNIHGELTEDSLPEGKGKEGKGKTLGASGDATDERFEEFWKTYPSRQSHSNPKKPAKDKFRTAVKSGVDPGAIIAGARQYAENVKTTNTDPKFVTQALTWLNQRRWEDQPEPIKARPKW